MSGLKLNVLGSLLLLTAGCYDIEDGSRADLLDLSDDRCDKSEVVYADYDAGALMSRSKDCEADVLIVTDIRRIEQEEPDHEAYWTNCVALNGARAGETCEGRFLCFREMSDNCLDRVCCMGSIERYSVCDSTQAAIPSPSAEHADCESAWEARPGDPCSGAFLCGMNHILQSGTVVEAPPETIPPFDEESGFGPADWDNERMVWCNNGRITVFHVSQII